MIRAYGPLCIGLPLYALLIWALLWGAGWRRC